MDTKYYTPEIEEFHDGFIYEIKMTVFPHEKKVFNFGITEYEIIKTVLNITNIVRVKLLDREDIESLEWKQNKNENSFSLNGFDLLFNEANNWITIYEDKGADEYCFRGTIKNKSEFKKLMVQLDIK